MIRYAESGGVSIAYETIGEGSTTLVYAHGFVGNLEVERQHPLAAAFLDRLAEIGRLVVFDRRGTGLSDRVRDLVVGSDVAFDARGRAALEGVPGEWELYAVRGT